MQLLAKSSICPGIITIIWSLITSNPTATGMDKEFDSPEEELRFINEQMKIQWEIEKAEYLSKQKATLTSGQSDARDHIHEAEKIPMVYKDQNGVIKESWQINY